MGNEKKMNYFDGQLLKADDFKEEQDYHLGSRKKHNWGLKEDTLVAKLHKRLIELKKEYEEGKKQVNSLEIHKGGTSERQLRIEGAIQVLEEVLSDMEDKDKD